MVTENIINSEDKKIGFFESVTILIGGMIGSAIFSLSGITMLSAGPSSVLSWLIAGIIMLSYGMLVCELSCRYPQSGGVYVFPRKAFGEEKGRFWGWLSCWGSNLTNIVAIAFGAIYIGTYLSLAFPWAANYQISLALAAILVAFFLNSIRFTTTGKINNIVVSALITTILIYVFAAFSSKNFKTEYFFPFFTQGIDGAMGFINAVPIAIIGYSSINAMAFMVSEVKKPDTTISKSMFVAISIVICTYALVILSTLGLITAEFLTQKPEMRFIPLFAACFTKMGNLPWLSGIISFSACLALMTTIIVCVSTNSRTLQAASNDGLLPSFLGKTNRYGVPWLSSATTCSPAAIIACFPKLTMLIVNFGAIFNVLTIGITIIALIFARARKEGLVPAFEAPGGKYLPAIVLTILIFCNLSSIVKGGLQIWIYTFVFFALGLIIYYARRFRKTVQSRER